MYNGKLHAVVDVVFVVTTTVQRGVEAVGIINYVTFAYELRLPGMKNPEKVVIIG